MDSVRAFFCTITFFNFIKLAVETSYLLVAPLLSEIMQLKNEIAQQNVEWVTRL